MKTTQHMSAAFLWMVSSFLLIAIAASHAVAQTCVPPPTGLIGWWSGDGNAEDIQGGHDGTLQNGVTFAAGKVGQAFRFDGVDDTIIIAHEAAFDLTTQVSADAWVFISGGDGNYQSVVNKGYYSAGPFELRMTREGDPLPVLLGCPDQHVIFFAVTTMNNIQNAGACITKSVWHHVVGTYDGTAVRLYLDGQVAISPNGTLGVVAQSGTLLQNNVPVSIGWNGSFGEVWSGLIDEVEIFNRALSDAEIGAIFNAGSAGKCKRAPNVPPVCDAAQAHPSQLWPPNHTLAPVRIVGVTDPDKDTITLAVTSVRQDEPVNGRGDGDTSPDAFIQGGRVLVRAERAGPLNGRVYHINFTADDGHGGQCGGTVTVCVPHNQSGRPCMDARPLYDSTQPY